MIPWPKIILGLAIAAALMWLYAEIRKDGAEAERSKIERQNNEAAANADKHALGYDACRDAGKLWDFRAGRCLGSPAGRGH